jgi:UDP-glucose 4-epimerase
MRGRVAAATDTSASAAKTGFDAVVHLAAFKAVGESMVKPEK